jgi:hypothetical protein
MLLYISDCKSFDWIVLWSHNLCASSAPESSRLVRRPSIDSCASGASSKLDEHCSSKRRSDCHAVAQLQHLTTMELPNHVTGGQVRSRG